MQNVFEFQDSFTASATGVLSSRVDFRKLDGTGGRGQGYVNHVRRMTIRTVANYTITGTASQTVVLRGDLAFGNLVINVPQAPKPIYNMPLSYLVSLYRLGHQGAYPPAFLTGQGGVAQPASDLWDGHTYTLVGTSDSVTIEMHFVLDFYDDSAAVPDDGIFPTSILSDANVSLATNAASAIKISGSPTVASLNTGTATLSVEMQALKSIQVPAWTFFAQDVLLSGNTQPTGLATYDGLTIASGIIPQQGSAQWATTDINQLGYRSDAQATIPGLSVQNWYDRFNTDAPTQTQFSYHYVNQPGRSQPLPLVWSPKTVAGASPVEDAENSNSAIVMNFDAIANTYVLVRKIKLAHGVSGQNLSQLKQAAGLPAHAVGQQKLKTPGKTAPGKRVTSTAPVRFSPKQKVR